MLYQGHDLNQVIVVILQCLEDISVKRYYGVTTLLDVLRGSMSKDIVSKGLNEVEGYGKLTGVKREDLAFIVDWLISNGYILRTKSRYPVLHHTNKGMKYHDNITLKQLQALNRELEQTDT